jgi:hypothetical protein
MPVHASTQEAEAGGPRVQGQPGLHGKTLSHKMKPTQKSVLETTMCTMNIVSVIKINLKFAGFSLLSARTHC